MTQRFNSYEEARTDVQDGDVVFVHGSKFRPLQYIVMYFTDSPFAHVGLAFWVTLEGGERRLMMVEAQGGSRRRMINMSTYRDRNIDVIKAPRPWEEISQEALDRERLGRSKYGWFDAVYIGLREKLSRYIRLPVTHFSGEICSEFVARLQEMPKVRVSPQRLWEEFLCEGEQVRLRVRPLK